MHTSLWSKKVIYSTLSLILAILIFSSIGYGIKVSPPEFRLEDNPGTTSSHEFTVTNDGSKPVDMSVTVGDWYRERNGQQRWLGRNAARWKAPSYYLSEGEELNITYRAKVPEEFKGNFQINGEVSVSRPDADLTVYGDTAYDINSGVIDKKDGEEEGPIRVTRNITPLSKENEVVLEVTVQIVASEDVRGLTLSEEYPVNTNLTNVESGGISIEYVNRSSADWLEVSPEEFTLEPGEAQDVEFSVSVPRGVQGEHWAAIYVTSEPLPVTREGTTIMAVVRSVVKVYESPPGTGRQEAYVTDFSAITTSIPKFKLELENEGNVELGIAGELRLRDETGEVVDTIDIDSFRLLPGYSRRLIIKGEEVRNLSPGKYNAVAILDYGAENRIGKSLSFEVKPLDLQPIGSSSSLPKDIDGDGLYEDIDGNGKIDKMDALTFSFNYDQPAVSENARAFDFNLDGAVNAKDAEQLMRMVEEGK